VFRSVVELPPLPPVLWCVGPASTGRTQRPVLAGPDSMHYVKRQRLSCDTPETALCQLGEPQGPAYGDVVFLEDLLKAAGPARQMIRSSGNPQAHDVETLLDVSARNVSAARLGVQLFDDPSSVGDPGDSATAETGAMLMVFGGGQTSVDLCASAFLRWRGHPRTEANREHDFGNLKHLVKTLGVQLGTSSDWFDAVRSSTDGKQLVNFRHAILHRLVVQNATVGAVRSTTITWTKGEPPEEASVLLDRLASFAEERWREFWQSLH
jgi:hypothetical protein